MEDPVRFDRLELFDPKHPDPAIENLDALAEALAKSPELAESVARRQRSDDRIRAALKAVEVPTSLREAVHNQLAKHAPSGSPSTLIESSTQASTNSRSSRAPRRRLLWSAGTILAASLMLAATWFFWPRASLPIDELCDHAAHAYRQFPKLADKAVDESDRAQFPADFNKAYFKACKLVDFMGRQVRGYQFSNQRHTVLVLMVPARRFPGNVDLPVTSSRSERGLSVHCSKDTGLAMVRVVVWDGDPRDLNRFKTMPRLT